MNADNPAGVEDGGDDNPVMTCDRRGPQGMYCCTRPDDHEGDHAAWGQGGVDEPYLVLRWRRGQ